MANEINSIYRRYNPQTGEEEFLVGGVLRSASGEGRKLVNALCGSIAYNVAEPYTVSLGKLPAGAVVVGTIVQIVTAFNAGTTNVLTVGTSSNASAFVGANDVNEGVAGTTMVGKKTDISEETEVFAKYTYTGDAPTAGLAHVTVLYLL